MRTWYHVAQRNAATLGLLLVGAGHVVACKGAAHQPRFAEISAPSNGELSMKRRAPKSSIPKIWEPFFEIRSAPAANERPFRAWGHFDGRYMASVRVSAEAREAYRTLSEETRLPAGTIVVMFHEEAHKHQTGPVFAMRKLAEARWEFLVTEADGRVKQRASSALCARCHSEGVADHLFGLPRESAQEPTR